MALWSSIGANHIADTSPQCTVSVFFISLGRIAFQPMRDRGPRSMRDVERGIEIASWRRRRFANASPQRAPCLAVPKGFRPLSARLWCVQTVRFGRRSRTNRGPGSRPTYSITSSARPSIESGNVMPSAFAALRLMRNSILVACWTGRSAGFSPLRIRPT